MVTQHTTRNQFEEEPEQSLDTATPLVEQVAPLEDLKVTGPRYTDSNLTSAWLVAANYDLNQKKEELAAEERAVIERSIARVKQDMAEPDDKLDTYSAQEISEYLQSQKFSDAAIEAAQRSLKKTEYYENLMAQTQLKDEEARRATIINNDLGTSPSEELVDQYLQEDQAFAKAKETIDREVNYLREKMQSNRAMIKRGEKLFSLAIDVNKIVFDNKRLKSHLKPHLTVEDVDFDVVKNLGGALGSVCFGSWLIESQQYLLGSALMVLSGTFCLKGITTYALDKLSNKQAASYLENEHSKVKDLINKIKAEGLHSVVSYKQFFGYRRYRGRGSSYPALIIDIYPDAQETKTPKLNFFEKLMNRFLFKKKK